MKETKNHRKKKGYRFLSDEKCFAHHGYPNEDQNLEYKSYMRTICFEDYNKEIALRRTDDTVYDLFNYLHLTESETISRIKPESLFPVLYIN